MNRRILITGANGQLGSEIRKLADKYSEFLFFFTDLPELNICEYDQLDKFVQDNKIDTLINCSAYTAVDKAEDDEKTAFHVNHYGVSQLVKTCEQNKVQFVHISTDYVFDGTANQPISADEKVSPIGVYGKSKLAGENSITESDVDALIIRTSWLYSSFGANFVKTMLNLGSNRDSLNVVFDQVGTPTYAYDLAKAILDILSENNSFRAKNNVYHYSNEGVCSWYDFAFEIMLIGKVNCKVFPVKSDQFPTKAERPAYSVLDKSAIKNDFGIEIPYWKESLKSCLNVINV